MQTPSTNSTISQLTTGKLRQRDAPPPWRGLTSQPLSYWWWYSDLVLSAAMELLLSGRVDHYKVPDGVIVCDRAGKCINELWYKWKLLQMWGERRLAGVGSLSGFGLALVHLVYAGEWNIELQCHNILSQSGCCSDKSPPDTLLYITSCIFRALHGCSFIFI